MANNTFTICFIIHRFLGNTNNAKVLLSRLTEDEKQTVLDLQLYRIKKYMSCYFDPHQHNDVIQDSFNMIVNTFPKEYNSIISYKNIDYYNKQELSK